MIPPPPSRREPSGLCGTGRAGSLLVFAALLLGGCAPARESDSVLLITIDTLRADHVGAYGYPRATSPRIDALARQGVLFEHVVAQSSWTKPATASILTG